MTRQFLTNDAGTRLAWTVPGWWWLCYIGETTDGIFNGRHAGIVATEEAATDFLEGGSPATMQIIYGKGNIFEAMP